MRINNNAEPMPGMPFNSSAERFGSMEQARKYNFDLSNPDYLASLQSQQTQQLSTDGSGGGGPMQTTAAQTTWNNQQPPKFEGSAVGGHKPAPVGQTQGEMGPPAPSGPQPFGNVTDQAAPTTQPAPTTQTAAPSMEVSEDRRALERQIQQARQSGNAGQAAYFERQLAAMGPAQPANPQPTNDPAAPDGGPPQWFQDWQAAQNPQEPPPDTEWTNPYAEGGELYGQFGNFDLSGGAGNRQLQNPIYGNGGYFDPANPVNIPDATEFQAVPWSGYNTFNPGGGMPGMPRGAGGFGMAPMEGPQQQARMAPGGEMSNYQGGGFGIAPPEGPQQGPRRVPAGGGANGFGIAPPEGPQQGPRRVDANGMTAGFQEPMPAMQGGGNKAVPMQEMTGGPEVLNFGGSGGIAPPEGPQGMPGMPRTMNGPTPDGGPAIGGGPVTMDQNGNVIPGQDLSPQAQAQNAQFDQFKSLMDPVFARQREAEQQRLANQGLPVSGEAYDNAYGDTLDAQNRQYGQAAWEAVGAGNQESQRQFDNMMTGAGFGAEESQRMFQNMFQNQQAGLDDAYRNRQLALQQYMGLQNNETQLEGQRIGAQAQTAMAQAQLAAQNARNAAELEMAQMQMQQAQEQFQYSQQLQQGQQSWQNAFNDRDWQFNAGMNSRNQWLNEMNQFMGTGYAQLGMPNVPMLDSTGAYQIGTNSANDRFNAQNSMYQAAQQRQADMWGAGIGAAGSFAMMSSRALKEDIVEPPANVVEDLLNLDVKQWQYKGESQRFIGPILEDTPDSLRDEETVNLANMIGGLVLAVQALADKVEKLEAER